MSLVSLYDEASLWMTPSGAKDGKLFSELPTDGSGDFTFSRGSNLAATRVDVNGLIEKGRENLLLNSIWNGVGSNVAPTSFAITSFASGTFDAGSQENSIRFTAPTSADRIMITQVPAITGVVTASVYVEQIHSGSIIIADVIARAGGSSNVIAFMEDGIVVNSNHLVSAGKTYSLTLSVASAVQWRFGVGTSGPTTGDITLSKPQVELGLVATDYIETTTTSVSAGVLENEPRLDYSGGASCPSLLLEPSRTQIITQSEYFGDAFWNKFNVIAELIDFASPDGQNNSYKITETTSNAQHAIVVDFLNRPTLSAGSHTHSCFVRANGVNDIVFYNNGTSGGAWVTIDLSDGTYNNLSGTATSASVEPYENDWYRISLTFTAVAGNTSPSIYLRVLGSYAGDGVSGIYMYGMQTELGSYPTSYIPTYGTSQTRSPDKCYLQSADVHSDDSGTMFFEVGDYDTATAPDGFRKIITANAVSASNIDNIIYFEEYAGSNTVLVRKNGISILQTTPLYQDLRNSKIAIKWSVEGAKVFINGVLNKTYTGDASLNLQYFGYATSYSGDVLSTIAIKQRVHFPTALNDSECIALTKLG